jgi:peptidoglycan-associated lipoprotein
MNFRLISKSTALVLVAIVAMSIMFVGCSKNAEVETEPTPEVVTPAEIVPEEVVPETKEIEVPTIDYANLEPADYGVEDVFFALDQYDLDNEAMSILSRNARIMREAGVVIMLSGHCDERGTVEYNMALGEKRALVVRDYLVSLGVPAGSLRTTSYGKSKPFAHGHNEDAWAMNRRAHFERP